MGANGAQAVRHHSWGNLNFSRTAPGITKWFWVTIEGYLSYILPKFEDFVPTGLGSGAHYIHARTYTSYPVHTCSRVLMDPCGLGGGPTLPYSLSLEEFFKTDRISKNIEPNIAKIHIQGFDIKDENQLLSKR